MLPQSLSAGWGKRTQAISAAQRELSAEELSAEVLKSLREDVPTSRRGRTTAVITVQPHLSAQCEATARAAELAVCRRRHYFRSLSPQQSATERGPVVHQRWLYLTRREPRHCRRFDQRRRLNILEHRGITCLAERHRPPNRRQYSVPAISAEYDLRATGPKAARIALLPGCGSKLKKPRSIFYRHRCMISLFDVGRTTRNAHRDGSFTDAATA